ncbi:MAG TPA: efflux RND transporter periplasmic adaptor subunit [Verrucomicrobiae bacterium]|jgi:membrane fusion protein, multidrug efflux system|nr:efflux RND transporter periplasmic adaptor subunit [Verrucomicrobiae bacterium]
MKGSFGRLMVVALATLALSACDRSPRAGAAPKPPEVTVVPVGQQTVPLYGQYVGQTEAVKTVEVRARVEGFILRQVAPDGAEVKEGDVLFLIDPGPIQAAASQAEANVARDRAALGQAEAALVQRRADVQQAQANVERDVAQWENWRTMEGRYRKLLLDELIAREQYDQINTSLTAAAATVQADRAALANAQAALAAGQANIENARATVRADEAALDAARLQLSYTTIRSPLTGRMGKAEVRVGALVGKGEATLLATVSTTDPMYVSFSVSEREALSVWRRRAAPGGIRITLPDDTQYPYEGKVDFVDRAVDPRTGTLALRATFPNPQRVLQPGQYMRLRALLEERPDALVIPQAAVSESQGATSVYVVAADHTVQVRSVRMGPRLGSLWIVEDGVKAGEQVIVKGLQRVQPGMRVEPTVEALPQATAG